MIPNIDTMPAGREMDALVAEKVMGWELAVELTKSVGSDCWMQWYPDRSDYEIRSSWWPSTSITPAWEVWEWAKRNEDRWEKFIWALPGSRSGIHSLCRELTPLAICRAAWKA